MNFVFPILMLMNADYKRIPWFVVMTGLVILFGHYIDIFNMIMPATVGDRWFIGIPEIGVRYYFCWVIHICSVYSINKSTITS